MNRPDEAAGTGSRFRPDRAPCSPLLRTPPPPCTSRACARGGEVSLHVPPTVLPYLGHGLRGCVIALEVQELERNLSGSSDSVDRPLVAYRDREQAVTGAKDGARAERRTPPVCEQCGPRFTRRPATQRHERHVHGKGASRPSWGWAGRATKFISRASETRESILPDRRKGGLPRETRPRELRPGIGGVSDLLRARRAVRRVPPAPIPRANRSGQRPRRCQPSFAGWPGCRRRRGSPSGSGCQGDHLPRRVPEGTVTQRVRYKRVSRAPGGTGPYVKCPDMWVPPLAPD